MVLNDGLAAGFGRCRRSQARDDVPDLLTKLQVSAWRVRRGFEASMLSDRESLEVRSGGGGRAESVSEPYSLADRGARSELGVCWSPPLSYINLQQFRRQKTQPSLRALLCPLHRPRPFFRFPTALRVGQFDHFPLLLLSPLFSVQLPFIPSSCCTSSSRALPPAPPKSRRALSPSLSFAPYNRNTTSSPFLSLIGKLQLLPFDGPHLLLTGARVQPSSTQPLPSTSPHGAFKPDPLVPRWGNLALL